MTATNYYHENNNNASVLYISFGDLITSVFKEFKNFLKYLEGRLSIFVLIYFDEVLTIKNTLIENEW